MKIGVVFGNPETTTGGNALKFYSSVRLEVRRAAQIKQGDQIIGNRVKVKVVKNKVAPPFQVSEFDIMYNRGISKEGDILDLATATKVIDKAGAWFSYKGEKIGQGREAVKKYLQENPKIYNQMLKEVKVVKKQEENA